MSFWQFHQMHAQAANAWREHTRKGMFPICLWIHVRILSDADRITFRILVKYTPD
jgi:hypothetical protein